MYKTVRHGENSLQYTILPQTEEVLSNSGLKGKGRDYSPSIHVRRSRKSYCFYGKCVLVFVFALIVILALASIPLCSIESGSDQKQLILQEVISASAPHTPAGRDIVKSRKKDLKTIPDETTIQSKLETSTTTALPITTAMVTSTTVMNNRAVTPPWTMPALRLWKSVTASSTVKNIATESHENLLFSKSSAGSIHLLDHYMSVRPWEQDIIIRPTVTPETITFRNVFRYDARPLIASEKSVTAKNFDDVLITSKPRSTTTSYATTIDNHSFKDLKDAILSVDDDDEFKESLEVDEVFSLPPLKPDSDSKAYVDDVTVSKTGGDWYSNRWPFVNNSAYFQWRHYSDNELLLPLLLATTGTAITMVILMLIVRRFKRTRAHIGDPSKTSTPLSQVDDNTNLLANVEDPEE